MQEVNRIACVNAAGFIQEFRVIWDAVATYRTRVQRCFLK
ncbi:hypothetical protein GGQ57_003080 [Parabacteroides faecis]|uniref:Uncharacterized protein n=1 Tax=Parabacteroides faecis TaxID=1217282 RepID=A0ABR6KP86_9BACT|nr:hypothetical protein [Parabacteroides faecis]